MIFTWNIDYKFLFSIVLILPINFMLLTNKVFLVMLIL